MPTILLIRHGENDMVKTGRMAGRLPDVHLNSRGFQQAQELSENLVSVPISCIYSSPLERAMETAAPLAEKLSLPVIINPGFLETDIGDWAGHEVKVIRKLKEWKIVQQSPSRFRFPNGESFFDCQNRLVEQMERVVKDHDDKEIIAIFTHADPIKLITAYYLGMPLDYFQKISCETASVTIWSFTEKNNRLIILNQKNKCPIEGVKNILSNFK